MKMVPVKEIPEKKLKKNLRGLCENFMAAKTPIVQVLFNNAEYKGARSCYCSFWNAAKSSKLPIEVRMSNNEVFLINKLLVTPDVLRSNNKRGVNR